MVDKKIITIFILLLSIVAFYSKLFTGSNESKLSKDGNAKTVMFRDTGKAILEVSEPEKSEPGKIEVKGPDLSHEVASRLSNDEKTFIERFMIESNTVESPPEAQKLIPIKQLFDEIPALKNKLNADIIASLEKVYLPEDIRLLSEEELQRMLDPFVSSSEQDISQVKLEDPSQQVPSLSENPYEDLDSDSIHATANNPDANDQKIDSLSDYLEANNSSMEQLLVNTDESNQNYDPENPYHQLLNR
jgi:hypothetical protein